jgi:hypothetical protein
LNALILDFFTFLNQSASLKMNLISIASLLLVVGVAAMVVDAQRKHQTGDGGVKFLPNCDYFGGDLVGIILPVEECGRACINHRGCNHFTYLDGACLLKRHRLNFKRTPCSSCAVCGFIPWRSG